MTFYSLQFLLLFLPTVLALFFVIAGRAGREPAIIFLVLASVLFYGLWNVAYVPLLAGSVLFNYAFGRQLQRTKSRSFLWLGIFANLVALGYFKYARFLLDNIDALTGGDWRLAKVAMPIGISFYTFQQIGWLVECYLRKDTRGPGFWTYALFVTFFPHLLAGPIVRRQETVPQFSRDSTFVFQWYSFAVGASIFIIGLSKKLLVADQLDMFITPVFTRAALGPVPPVTAWLAALCYALQLYMDFSGYSDMAIGSARMFNVRLPMNFNSPYKTPAIIDFWKAWHITMTRFFQSYVYTPLSAIFFRLQKNMGLAGELFMYVSILITLVAIGLWHGANWTFIVFGFLHGCALVINQIWRALRKKMYLPAVPHYLGVFLTFFFFMLTAVLLRADSMAIAGTMYKSMFFPSGLIADKIKINIFLLAIGTAMACFFLPNTQQVFRRYRPVADAAGVYALRRFSSLGRLVWRPNAVWGALLLVLYLSCLNMIADANRVKEFVYFKF